MSVSRTDLIIRRAQAQSKNERRKKADRSFGGRAKGAAAGVANEILDIVARGEYASASAAREALRGERNPLDLAKAYWSGLSAQSRITFTDIAREEFNLSTDPSFNAPDFLPDWLENLAENVSSPAGLVGFGLGIALDAFTYAGIGTLTRVGSIARLGKAGATVKRGQKIARQLEAIASRRGLDPDLVRSAFATAEEVPVADLMRRLGLPSFGETAAEQFKLGQRGVNIELPFGTQAIGEFKPGSVAVRPLAEMASAIHAGLRSMPAVRRTEDFFSNLGVDKDFLHGMAKGKQETRATLERIELELESIGKTMYSSGATDPNKQIRDVLEEVKLTETRADNLIDAAHPDDVLPGSAEFVLESAEIADQAGAAGQVGQAFRVGDIAVARQIGVNELIGPPGGPLASEVLSSRFMGLEISGDFDPSLYGDIARVVITRDLSPTAKLGKQFRLIGLSPEGVEQGYHLAKDFRQLLDESIAPMIAAAPESFSARAFNVADEFLDDWHAAHAGQSRGGNLLTERARLAAVADESVRAIMPSVVEYRDGVRKAIGEFAEAVRDAGGVLEGSVSHSFDRFERLYEELVPNPINMRSVTGKPFDSLSRQLTDAVPGGTRNGVFSALADMSDEMRLINNRTDYEQAFRSAHRFGDPAVQRFEKYDRRLTINSHLVSGRGPSIASADLNKKLKRKNRLGVYHQIPFDRFEKLPEDLRIVGARMEQLFEDVAKMEREAGIRLTTRPAYFPHMAMDKLDAYKILPSFGRQAITRKKLPFTRQRRIEDTISNINEEIGREYFIEDILSGAAFRILPSVKAASYNKLINRTLDRMGTRVRSVDEARELMQKFPELDIYMPNGRFNIFPEKVVRVGRQLAAEASPIASKYTQKKGRGLIQVDPSDVEEVLRVGGQEVHLLPASIADALNRANFFAQTPEGLSLIQKLLLGSRRIFVRMTLPLFPAWGSRNLQGNVWLAAVAGLTNPKRISDAFRINWKVSKHLRSGEGGRLRAIKEFGDQVLVSKETGERMNLWQLWRESMEEAVQNTGWGGAEELLELSSKMKREIKGGKKALFEKRPVSELIEFGFRVNSFHENVMRFALFIDRRLKGDPKSLAGKYVREAMYDLDELAPADAFIRDYAAAFWPWIRKNVPRHVFMAAERPRILATPAKMIQAIEASDDPDDEVLSQWMEDAFAVRLGQKKDGSGQWLYSVLRGSWPAADLQLLMEMGSPDTVMSMLNPWWRLPVELNDEVNRDFWTRRPVVQYPGQDERFAFVLMPVKAAHVLGAIRPLQWFDRFSREVAEEFRAEPAGGRGGFNVTLGEQVVRDLTGLHTFAVDFEQTNKFARRAKDRNISELRAAKRAAQREAKRLREQGDEGAAQRAIENARRIQEEIQRRKREPATTIPERRLFNNPANP